MNEPWQIKSGTFEGRVSTAIATSPNPENLRRFAAAYRDTLAAAQARHPEEYAFSPANVPHVAAKMTASLAAGTATLGPAGKAAARRLGIKPTLGAIRAFLTQADPAGGARKEPTVPAEMIAGAARCAWALAWANAEEEAGRRAAPGGCDILDYAPPTTPEATVWAEKLMADVAAANPGADLDAASGGELETLGHYLALESMGHGAAWSDSREPHGLRVPHVDGFYL